MNKENIIAEIKRTAKENGGKPLGTKRFEYVTGIKPYDWSRYWARFGDAQREAGFEPNTLQVGYSDNFLLEKLALLTRELNKFPTKNELRIKSFNDPDFPSPNTFARWGGRNQMAAKTITFCTSKPEYADVIEIIGEVKVPETLDNSQSDNIYGFVYLIKGHPGEYKIGRTNLVDRRLSELGAIASVEQELVHEIKTDDPAGVEAYWHRRFADKRMRGEWFKLSRNDVKTFKRWRRIY